MTTKTVRVDRINGTWAASFEGQAPSGFGGDSPVTAIMGLVKSTPEYDFLLEEATADFDLMTDDHLVIKIPCQSSAGRFKEALVDKHLTLLLKAVAAASECPH